MTDAFALALKAQVGEIFRQVARDVVTDAVNDVVPAAIEECLVGARLGRRVQLEVEEANIPHLVHEAVSRELLEGSVVKGEVRRKLQEVEWKEVLAGALPLGALAGLVEEVLSRRNFGPEFVAALHEAEKSGVLRDLREFYAARLQKVLDGAVQSFVAGNGFKEQVKGAVKELLEERVERALLEIKEERGVGAVSRWGRKLRAMVAKVACW